MKKSIHSLLLLIFAAFIFFSCDNPAGSDPADDTTDQTTEEETPDPEPVKTTGYFIDGPVAGLKYTTSSGLTGTTDASGSFEYMTGDTIQFTLGGKALGAEISGGSVITPVDVCQAADIASSEEATNMVRLLLALDDGTNPFGLTLPSDIDTLMAGIADLNALLADDAALAAAVTGMGETLPTDAEALAHFALSEELADCIEAGAGDDNVFVTVKLPAGSTGELGISYKLKEEDRIAAGITLYNSGQSRTINSSTDTVSFSEAFYKGNWTMTLYQFVDNSKVSVDDILSFYTADGFATTLPADFSYPLAVGDEKVILQADLSSAGAVVSEVVPVSGKMKVPKTLPDGKDFTYYTDTESDYLKVARLSLFVDIKPNSSSSYDAASFSLSPAMDASGLWDSDWSGNASYYSVGYTTALPKDFFMDLQTFLSANYIYYLVEWYNKGTVYDAGVTTADFGGSNADAWEERDSFAAGVQAGIGPLSIKDSVKNPIFLDSQKGLYRF